MAAVRRRVHPVQKVLFILCAFLFVIALISSLVQVGVFLFGDEIKPYIRAQADKQNSQLPEQRGTFVRENGTFYEVLGFEILAPELLEKTVQVPHDDMDGVYVYRAAIEQQADFTLYWVPLTMLNDSIQVSETTGDSGTWERLSANAEIVPVRVERIGTSTVTRMVVADGNWQPGGYMLRLPPEGTGFGTFWYYFVVVE